MRRPRALALAALTTAAVATAGSVEAAVAPTASCQHPKSKTIFSNKVVRVFRVGRVDVGNFTTRRLYACLLSADRPLLLTSAYDDGDYREASYGSVRLAGRFVAWSQVASDVTCSKYQDCGPDYEATVYAVGVADLKRRKVLRVPGSVADGALVLSTGGAVGWLQRAGEATEVRTRASNGSLRIVDTGAIAPSSLTLSGSTLSWVNDGVTRTATLS